MVEYSVAALLGLWFLATVLTQLTTWPGAPKSVAAVVDWFQQYDLFAVVPNWNFFAPNPGTTDYHLLYRDRLDGGDFSMWREIATAKQSGLLRGIWNPRKRQSKVISDVVSALNEMGHSVGEMCRKQAEEELTARPDGPKPSDEEIVARATELAHQHMSWIRLSVPYLIILVFLSHREHPPFSSATQFLVAETRSYDPDRPTGVLMVSELHDL